MNERLFVCDLGTSVYLGDSFHCGLHCACIEIVDCLVFVVLRHKHRQVQLVLSIEFHSNQHYLCICIQVCVVCSTDRSNYRSLAALVWLVSVCSLCTHYS